MARNLIELNSLIRATLAAAWSAAFCVDSCAATEGANVVCRMSLHHLHMWLAHFFVVFELFSGFSSLGIQLSQMSVMF